jgi:hypothetical protein
MNSERDRELSMLKLREFERFCTSTCIAYSIVIDVVEAVFP